MLIRLSVSWPQLIFNALWFFLILKLIIIYQIFKKKLKDFFWMGIWKMFFKLVFWKEDWCPSLSRILKKILVKKINYILQWNVSIPRNELKYKPRLRYRYSNIVWDTGIEPPVSQTPFGISICEFILYSHITHPCTNKFYFFKNDILILRGPCVTVIRW